MKRLIALLLTFSLVFGTCALSASAKKDDSVRPRPPYEWIDCDYPFVLIRGMDFDKLLEHPDSDDAEPALKELDKGLLVRNVFSGVFKGLIHRDWNVLADYVIEIVDQMMGKMACNPDGTPKYDTGVEQYPKALAYYPDLTRSMGFGVEEGLLHRAMESYGAKKVYYYNYDWRIDPYIHAEKIHALVEQAKQDHKVDKVNLVCCSMGGILTDAYLYKYGAESLHRVLFVSSTFYGTYVTGDLLNGRVKIYGDLLYNFFVTRLDISKPLAFLLKILNKMGLFKAVERLANNEVIPEIKDHVYDSFMRDVFCTMPVLWALTQPEDVDSALDYIFHGKEETYAGVIKLAKEYKVMNLQRDEMLKRMEKEGLEIVVAASYELPVVPVYEHGNVQGDTVLESELMLGGATMSLLGQKLPDDYQPLDKRYYSPDREVDLSTALFPNTTWALKNVPHVFTSYGTECQDMLMWMVNSEACPTVFSNKNYPQFLLSNGKLELDPLEY